MNLCDDSSHLSVPLARTEPCRGHLFRRVEAIIKSREALSYGEAQARIDDPKASRSFAGCVEKGAGQVQGRA